MKQQMLLQNNKPKLSKLEEYKIKLRERQNHQEIVIPNEFVSEK